MSGLLGNLLPRRRQPVIGVDIGTGAVKVVEVRQDKGGFCLQRIGIATLSEGMVNDGVITDLRAVEEKIREAVGVSGSMVKQVVSAVSGPNVISRYVDFPRMEKKELLNALKYEADKYIPLPPDECYMDADIVNDSGEEETMKVLLVAAPKNLVELQVEAIQGAGLTPVAIDLQPLAMSRALLPDHYRETAVIVDIGASATKVAIFMEGVMVFTRAIPLGGNRFTSTIMSDMNLDWRDAESFKLRPNFLDQAGEELQRDIGLLMNDIKREIRRSVEYFLSRGKEASVGQFIVTGGTAMLADLAKSLSAEMGTEIRIGNPGYNMKLGPAFDRRFVDTKGPTLAVATGLAMRGGGFDD